MARDGSGNYSLPAGNPVSSGTTISSSTHNSTMSDVATALTASLAKDGQTTPTANLPMGTYRHTNVGDASARNHYGVVGQIQDGDYNVCSSVAGTNTVTASLTPAITSYSAGMIVVVVPANTNTGATTLAINGLTALDILKASGDALVAGDLVQDVPAFLVLDGAGDDWFLLNPQSLTAVDESRTLTAGVGLSGGGDLSANRTFTVDLNELTTETSIASGDFLAMVDITDNGSGKITFSNLTSALTTALNHDSLTGFVADEHIAHSGVSITAGAGLTGGGDISATRTINVVGGDGITANANDIEVDSTVVRTTGSQSVNSDNDTADEIGWKGSPINTQNGNYTLLLTDAGRTIHKASGGSGETITIPANASVGFPVGTLIGISNSGGGTLSIAITSDTLVNTADGATGTRTLADDGMAVIQKVASTTWKISGNGLT